MKLIISFVIVLLTGTFYVQAQKSELEGRTFHIKLTLIEGKGVQGSAWTEDEIIFTRGRLNPKYMGKHEQFPPAPCEIKVGEFSGKKVITFSAAHRNRGESDIKWEGTVTGNRIEGTAIWTNMHGPRTYSFTGETK